MSRFSAAIVSVVLLVGLATVASAQELALKDYMPQTVGSTWTMKDAGDGDLSTTEVTSLMEIGDQQVPMAITKNAEGVARRGTLELVTGDAYSIFGTMRRQRGQEGGELNTMLYPTPARYPGTLTLGEGAEATVKMTFGEREIERKTTLTIEAIEDVTVPAGTFEDCIKLVTTTTTQRGERNSTAWYATGIGLVKSERPGFGERPATVRELTEYEIAE